MQLTPAQRAELLKFVSLGLRPGRRMVLIACAKTKGDVPAPAALLYRSDTFKKSVGLAKKLEVEFYIISAKHGLLSPHCVIAPYDTSMHDLNHGEREQWARNVNLVLAAVAPTPEEIWILGSDHYAKPLATLLSSRSKYVHAPLSGLPIGKMNGWLSMASRYFERRRLLGDLYAQLGHLADKKGLPTLKELLDGSRLPRQGIYIFLDPSEPTEFSTTIPRIVRIGTHAVSQGSKAELRTRLRTHLGTRAGDGNHRGSIFRLHVGAAVCRRDNLKQKYAHWGKGQTAGPDVRRSEGALEQSVSSYIGALQVLVLEIADLAGPLSQRAYFEKQLIALLTEDEIYIDQPSQQWLGQHADRDLIRASGLWNLQHIGEKLDPKFIDRFRTLISRTGELPF